MSKKVTEQKEIQEENKLDLNDVCCGLGEAIGAMRILSEHLYAPTLIDRIRDDKESMYEHEFAEASSMIDRALDKVEEAYGKILHSL